MRSIFSDRRYLIPFRSGLLPQIFTDVLVIGAGVAGLRAALEAAHHTDVVVLAKEKLESSNTAWAQGGIAAVTDPSDSIEGHARDTLEAGAGLCSKSIVQHICREAPQQIRQLIDMGMPFDRSSAGVLSLGREGGHGANRILHADGDATGWALSQTLLKAARNHERIRLFEGCLALDLLTVDGECLGAITHHAQYGLQVIWASAVILAAGGCGQVYRETTNPSVATGDALAMAYRAGAAVADLEFMQFHPTTLYIAGASRSLISEAVRGEGATLVNDRGQRFMLHVHHLAELAPRDIVSQAIARELAAGPDTQVYLDARTIGSEGFARRFPGITAQLSAFDIDPGKDLIPIRPAAHYMIGGVWADLEGSTNIRRLLACGEAACTGLHGANRLASNSLLEGLVCGTASGAMAVRLAQTPPVPPRKIISDIRISDRNPLDLDDVRTSLRSLMWRHVGIERDQKHLQIMADKLDFWARYTLDKIFDDRDGWEVQNLLWVAALMTRAALTRKESRGTHLRSDHPTTDPTQHHHLVWQNQSGAPQTIAAD